jgi:hypothetical protein
MLSFHPLFFNAGTILSSKAFRRDDVEAISEFSVEKSSLRGSLSFMNSFASERALSIHSPSQYFANDFFN